MSNPVCLRGAWPLPKARPVLAPGSRGTGKPSEVKSVPMHFLFFIVIYSKVAEEPERTGNWGGAGTPFPPRSLSHST